MLNSKHIKTQQETVTVVYGIPLRLSFEPDAIQEHFSNDQRVTALSHDQLLEIGEVACSNDIIYEAFHHALRAAIKEIAGFSPEDNEEQDTDDELDDPDPGRYDTSTG